MESIFEYDPPSWYNDNPKRQTEIKVEHDAERRELGVSIWDLYNFDSYYASLVFGLARESETRDMGLTREVKASLRGILNMARHIEALEIESDELFEIELRSSNSLAEIEVDKIAEIDKEQVRLKSEAIERFIFDILPTLPFKSDSWVRSVVDRVPFGLAEDDYEFIGSTMNDRLVTGIHRFVQYTEDETKKVRSHPGNYTMEEWVERLREMEQVVRELSSDSKNKPSSGEREKFMKDFVNLWV